MWKQITEDAVRAVMNSAEDNAARAKYLSAGQSDPLCEVRDQVVADFREAIRSNAENTLSEDEALLPPSAIGHAVVIIRHKLLGRFGMTITDGRMEEYRTAQKYLAKLESGERKVSLPGAASPAEKTQLPGPMVNQSPRRDGWRDQDGI
jgi:hypothetical protein